MSSSTPVSPQITDSPTAPSQSPTDASALAPDHVIVMARCPEPGRTKTRLIPALGAQRAADLHTQLVRSTLLTLQRFQTVHSCVVEIHFADGNVEGMQKLFGAEFPLRPQKDGDLGHRMQAAAESAFAQGARRVVIIGTDCPALDVRHLQAAFLELQTADIVLGPALDGGYYLLGQRRNHPQLFQGIPWGTEYVRRQTLRQARVISAAVCELECLSDVDFAEDLLICRTQADRYSDVLERVQPGLLSIIIPALNEERTLPTTLQSLQHMSHGEVIVADGGSSDRTVEIARAMGARVVQCNAGRGRQMNAGAALARGEFLLFLHADTILPPQFESHVRQTLAPLNSANPVAGAFHLRIEHAGWLLRGIAWAANQRSRWLQLPYGDQAIFLRSNRFFQMGGFLHWPLMEDFELCRRLQREGRIQLVPASATTSDRRWKQRGVVRTTLINLLCVSGYFLGISPQRLARFYRGRMPKKVSQQH